MDDLPVTLTRLAEALGCDVDYLHEMRRKAVHPLPCRTLPGRRRGWFTKPRDFWAWLDEEEGESDEETA